MKWTETITPKQAAEELGVPYHGWMREMDRAWISEDQKYSVMSRLLRTEWGKVEHVTITAAEGVGRSDGSGDIPWAVKMEMHRNRKEAGRIAEHCEIVEEALLGCTKGCTQETHPAAPQGCIFQMHPESPAGWQAKAGCTAG